MLYTTLIVRRCVCVCVFVYSSNTHVAVLCSCTVCVMSSVACAYQWCHVIQAGFYNAGTNTCAFVFLPFLSHAHLFMPNRPLFFYFILFYFILFYICINSPHQHTILSLSGPSLSLFFSFFYSPYLPLLPFSHLSPYRSHFCFTLSFISLRTALNHFFSLLSYLSISLSLSLSLPPWLASPLSQFCPSPCCLWGACSPSSWSRRSAQQVRVSPPHLTSRPPALELHIAQTLQVSAAGVLLLVCVHAGVSSSLKMAYAMDRCFLNRFVPQHNFWKEMMQWHTPNIRSGLASFQLASPHRADKRGIDSPQRDVWLM